MTDTQILLVIREFDQRKLYEMYENIYSKSKIVPGGVPRACELEIVPGGVPGASELE